MNALSVPLALAAGVQNADFVRSIVLFVVLQKAAVAALVPILSVPLDTALTTNEVTEPSTSVSLPVASKSLNAIVVSVFLAVVFTALAIKL